MPPLIPIFCGNFLMIVSTQADGRSFLIAKPLNLSSKPSVLTSSSPGHMFLAMPSKLEEHPDSALDPAKELPPFRPQQTATSTSSVLSYTPTPLPTTPSASPDPSSSLLTCRGSCPTLAPTFTPSLTHSHAKEPNPDHTKLAAALVL